MYRMTCIKTNLQHLSLSTVFYFLESKIAQHVKMAKEKEKKNLKKCPWTEDLCKSERIGLTARPPCFCLLGCFWSSFLHLCLSLPHSQSCTAMAGHGHLKSQEKCLSGQIIQESCVPRNVEKIHLFFFLFLAIFPLG